jgi:hypothetical protein
MPLYSLRSDCFKLLLIAAGLIVLGIQSPHLFRWEVLAVVISVPVVGIFVAACLCRILFGHWGK